MNAVFHRGILRWLWWLPLPIPSLWLWFHFPPLWRDSDGYAQLTSNTGVMTVLQWPPLYCLGARLPLALGAWWQGAPHSLASPTLTDPGIGLLIGGQHLLLWIAAAGLIATAARGPVVRLLLACVFTGQASFYAYAHTVGSESLSNTLQIATIATGFLVIKSAPPRWPMWLAWWLALTLAILTRHINAALALTLPLVYGLRLLATLPASWRERTFRALQAPAIALALAIGLGVAGVAVAQLTARVLCATAYQIEYRSRIGYVMQWRLSSLEDQPAGARRDFLRSLEARVSDPPTTAALEAYESALEKPGRPPTSFLGDYLVDQLRSAGPISVRRARAISDEKLNRVAREVILSGSPLYREMVLRDFQALFGKSLADFTAEPFGNTTWLADQLPARYYDSLPPLASFRTGFYARPVVLTHFRYLRLGDAVALWGICLLAALAWLVVVALRRRTPFASEVLYPPAVVFTGLVLFFLNCLFTVGMTRFGLPLLVSLVAALFYCLGAWGCRKG